MIDSNDNKSSPNLQYGKLQNPFSPNFQGVGGRKIEVEAAGKIPTPDKASEDKEYLSSSTVAKIIGVTRKTVEYWRKQGLFNADMIDHKGTYYYEVERVMQLKAVYRPNWTRGSYQVKFISKETVAKINLLSPETLSAHGIIRLVPNKNAEYVCPFCNNGGNGNRDATGIKPKIFQDHVGWKCHRCGEVFDNLKIFADYFGINDKTDFRALVEKICNNFNLPVITNAPFALEKKSEVPPAELNLINQDLASSSDALKIFVEQCGGLWRGIPFDVLAKFGCRYIENWTPPKTRAAQIFTTPTPRIIIPANADGLHSNYLARLTVPLDSFDEQKRPKIREKPHAGKKTLFNADALNMPLSRPVFAVEGYIDAMSIEYAGFPAVALGGADGGNLLVDALKSLQEKPKIIILFDPDETGRKLAPRLQNELLKIGCPSVIKFLSETDSKIDANQILQEQGADFLMNKLFTVEQESKKDFEILEEKKPAAAETFSSKAEPPATLKLTFEQKKFLYRGDFTDLDFGRRIHFMYGDNIRYLQEENSWLILDKNKYGGGVWKNRGEKKAVIEPFALKLADSLIANAVPEPKPLEGNITAVSQEILDKIYRQSKLHEYQTDLGKHLKSQQNISRAVEIMKGIESIIIHPEDLNRHKHLLNVLNGVIDLQTGELLTLNPSFLIMNQAGAVFDDRADTAFVEKFFSDILPDEQTRRAVLRYLGYGLTGEKNYHISEFWKGGGANGKSTAIDLILKVCGTYAKKMPTAGILENRRPADGNSATPAIAQLDGDIRLAVIDELPRNARIDAALFKTLTGDETAYSRALYCNPRTIELRAKFIINGNHLPTFDTDDEGMLRRINNVAFTQTFKGLSANSHIAQELSTKENRSAFLKILVAEAVNFYREGLLESEAMKQAKEEYISESDFVGNFITDNCLVGQGGEITRKAFETKILADYPKECSRLKKKELLYQIISKIEPLGAIYTKQRDNKNIFRNIRWLDSDE